MSERNKETILQEIEVIKTKLENKGYFGGAIPKAKKDLEELEKELSELEDLEEIEDLGEEEEKSEIEPEEKEKPEIESEEEEKTEIKPEVKPEAKPEAKPEVKSEAKKEEILLAKPERDFTQEFKDLEKSTGKKRYMFKLNTPYGKKMRLHFKNGVFKDLIKGQIVELTADELAVWPGYFKEVKTK